MDEEYVVSCCFPCFFSWLKVPEATFECEAAAAEGPQDEEKEPEPQPKAVADQDKK